MSAIETGYCLLVSRAGKTNIFPLTTERSEIQFGYAPSEPERDLILYDGLLQNVHGAILYDEEGSANTNFYLKAYADSIQLNEMSIAPRDGVRVPLQVNNKIAVGRKYILTFSRYQPLSLGTQTVSTYMQTEPTASVPSPNARYLQESLGSTSRLLMPHMPEIYHPGQRQHDPSADFLTHFLALFESIIIPWNWTIENFDLFVHPQSAPPEFLPWLTTWYGTLFWDDTLPPAKQRVLLCQLSTIVKCRGTVSGLRDLLSCYVDRGTIEIDDVRTTDSKFVIRFLGAQGTEFTDAKKEKIKELVDWYKPVHTTYTLDFPAESVE